MTIDWDKPLECEHGIATCIGIWGGRIYVMCGDTKWLVNNETGEPTDSWMPRVYNAKRKPKEGEWWKVENNVEHITAMFYRGGSKPWCKTESPSEDGYTRDRFKPISVLMPLPQDEE